MKKLEKQVEVRLGRTEEIGMANLLSEDTNVPCYIYIRQKPDTKHKVPTLKISRFPIKQNRMSNVLTISITDSPSIIEGTVHIPSESLEKVYAWVRLNLDLLLKYWNGEIHGTKQVLLGLKPIPKT